jgi:hypothetical protein
MRDLIVVNHIGNAKRSLKRDILIFDRIAVIYQNLITGDNSERLMTDYFDLKEMEWLISKGILFFPDIDQKLKQREESPTESNIKINEDLNELNDVIEIIQEKRYQNERITVENNQVLPFERDPCGGGGFGRRPPQQGLIEETATSVRFAGISLRSEYEADIVPIFDQEEDVFELDRPKKTDVFYITLEKLPIPDELTPWEQIIEFRQDPDTRNKFPALRRWMSKVIKNELKPNEIVQELEELLHVYQQHYKLHKIKMKNLRFKTAFTIVPEIIEHLIRLQFGGAAKSLFEFREKKIELMEAELKLPSSEVAYIIKAHEKFK